MHSLFQIISTVTSKFWATIVSYSLKIAYNTGHRTKVFEKKPTADDRDYNRDADMADVKAMEGQTLN
jgi:hypothetical protein